MEEEDETFNLESSEATTELEEVLRSEAIGDTLYDRRWVLKTIMGLVSDPGKTDLTDKEESDLVSLCDMSAERDVCAFLAESGCADVVLNGMAADGAPPTSREVALRISANVIEKCEGFWAGRAAWAVPVAALFSSEEAGVVAAALSCCGAVCAAAARAVAREEEEEGETGKVKRANVKLTSTSL